MYKKILLGVDGSKESNKTLKKVIELKKLLNSDVVIFHSVKHHYVPQLVPVMFPFGINYAHTLSEVDIENIREDYRKAGELILNEAKKLFENEKLTVETVLDLDESPEDYIKRIVKVEDFDLIVLGYRGHHSKLRNAILGSVPEKIIEHVNCDVLIIK